MPLASETRSVLDVLEAVAIDILGPATTSSEIFDTSLYPEGLSFYVSARDLGMFSLEQIFFVIKQDTDPAMGNPTIVSDDNLTSPIGELSITEFNQIFEGNKWRGVGLVNVERYVKIETITTLGLGAMGTVNIIAAATPLFKPAKNDLP